MNIFSELEEQFYQFILKYLEYEQAVIITDLIQLALVFILGYLVCFLHVPRIFRGDIHLSDKLKNLVYQVHKYEDSEKSICEIEVKKPHNYKEKLQMLIGLYDYRFFRKSKFKVSAAKAISVFLWIITIVLFVCLLIAIGFAFNVITPPHPHP